MRVKLFFLFLIISNFIFADNGLDSIWSALNSNSLRKARTLMNEEFYSKGKSADAGLGLIFLNLYEGKSNNLEIMKLICKRIDDPSPYLYALWFTNAVTDGYGKKEAARLAYLNEIISNPKLNKSLIAGGQYILGTHYLSSNKISSSYTAWAPIQSIKKWQFVGPFDNTSGCGFDKDYDPIRISDMNTTFKSESNSDIKWFIPAHPQKDPWISTIYHQPKKTGITYAQCNIAAPNDMNVYVGVGASGSLKVWINDKLIISSEEDYKTEIDYFRAPCKLKKGNNRILVQLGYTYETSYPNFLVRFTDKQGNPEQGLVNTEEIKDYPKDKDTSKVQMEKHFAEKYFEERISKDSSNLVNYLLLSRVYLRCKKSDEAINLLKAAEKRYPDALLIKYQLLLAYNDADNRTEILKCVEDLRAKDEKSLFISTYDFGLNMGNENYDLAEENLTNIRDILGENDEEYYNYNIRLLLAKEKQREAIEAILKAYQQYPENSTYVMYNYYITKASSKSSSAGFKVLNTYLAKNYNSSIYELLLKEYADAGMTSKQESTLLKLLKMFPEESDYADQLVGLYYQMRNYPASMKYVEYQISNAPYNASNYNTKALVLRAMNKEDLAKENFQKAIHYDPNRFESREYLRELNGTKPVLSYVKNTTGYERINKALKADLLEEENYEVIFDEKSYFVFPEGASVEYSSFALRVMNNNGIDDWKEVSIPVNYNYQRLIIEKSEVVKKNGQKVAAERSGNQIVFPSLEKGDAIYIEYRFENYTYGKLRKEFFNDYVFNGFVPTKEARLRLFVPKNYAFDKQTINLEIEPEVSTVDDFTCYDWSIENPAKCKDESYMPEIEEVGIAIDISTVKSWRNISEWYMDLALPQAKVDYTVEQAYKQIFDNKTFTNEFQKAKAIYEYICSNIRYSSVSFRQSNYVPQKPMKTISTQLGDCKDLSLLFYTLAKKAGIKTNLVLVSTRDRGENTIRMPSINFNHCIIRMELDGKVYFQELTDKTMTFITLPGVDVNAQALVIPNSTSDTLGNQLIHIPDNKVIQNSYSRKTTVTVNENNLHVKTDLETNGVISAIYREHLYGLSSDELKKKTKKMLESPFVNQANVTTYTFDDTEKRDSLWHFSGEFDVKGEVKEIGSFQAVKPPFYEDIFTSSSFSEEERTYPILYWLYENADSYYSEVKIIIPAGKKVFELPQGLTINKSFINYKLEIQKKSDTEVIVKRTVKLNTGTIPANQYADFKETIKKILKAEDMFITFK